MRVFVTGATGFIGRHVVASLLSHGHKVLGLTRSAEGEAALIAAGAEPLRADLRDLDRLAEGARTCDAVIHLGFIHDFTTFMENCLIDQHAIEAMGAAMTGSNKPLIVTSGLAGLVAPGQIAGEDAAFPEHFAMPRVSEPVALSFAAKGVRAAVIRLPQVHDRTRQGLVSYLIDLARRSAVSAYVGDGQTRWAAAHVLDVAELYRLVLEHGVAGGRYHGVDEEGISMGSIAEAIGRAIKVPVKALSGEEAQAHFGWMSMFAGADLMGSSHATRAQLGWQPKGPGLIEDLDHLELIAV